LPQTSGFHLQQLPDGATLEDLREIVGNSIRPTSFIQHPGTVPLLFSAGRASRHKAMPFFWAPSKNASIGRVRKSAHGFSDFRE